MTNQQEAVTKAVEDFERDFPDTCEGLFKTARAIGLDPMPQTAFMLYWDDEAGRVRQHYMCLGMPGLPDEKPQFYAFVRHLCEKYDAACFAMVSEAWAATAKTDSEARDPTFRPSQAPDRRDTLLATFETRLTYYAYQWDVDGSELSNRKTFTDIGGSAIGFIRRTPTDFNNQPEN